MHLDHTIVPSHDKVGSAKFFARIMGVEYKGEHGPFAPVEKGFTDSLLGKCARRTFQECRTDISFHHSHPLTREWSIP